MKISIAILLVGLMGSSASGSELKDLSERVSHLEKRALDMENILNEHFKQESNIDINTRSYYKKGPYTPMYLKVTLGLIGFFLLYRGLLPHPLFS